MNNKTPQQDKSHAVGRSDSNGGLGQFPPERTHRKTEVWWLIETDSPAVYMAPHGWITNKAWDAYRFISKRGAEAFLESQREFWDREKSVGVKEWRIIDHLFYV